MDTLTCTYRQLRDKSAQSILCSTFSIENTNFCVAQIQNSNIFSLVVNCYGDCIHSTSTCYSSSSTSLWLLVSVQQWRVHYRYHCLRLSRLHKIRQEDSNRLLCDSIKRTTERRSPPPINAYNSRLLNRTEAKKEKKKTSEITIELNCEHRTCSSGLNSYKWNLMHWATHAAKRWNDKQNNNNTREKKPTKQRHSVPFVLTSYMLQRSNERESLKINSHTNAMWTKEKWKRFNAKYCSVCTRTSLYVI